MPKMRGIKPETWTDDKIVELSPLARLLFIGMWNYACDNGHVENKPKQLKLRILPADDCDVAALVKETVDVGCVVDHGDHLSIPTLPQHQRIDRRYFTSCDHCDPDEIPASPNGHTQGTRRAHSGDTTGSRVEGRKEGEMKEGEGERSAAGKPAERDLDADPDFVAFWQTYPRREDKGHARKAWMTKVVRASVNPKTVIGAAESYAVKVATSERKFIAMPATWLNGERWLDETDQPEEVNGWHRPSTPPPAPPEVADDPERYAQWLADWRAEVGR